jgi:ubiquinone biosynthesis monooxygenase Coq6
MGVSNFALSYKQMGVVATIEIDDTGDNSTAWQRFLPTGPVALLPLTNTLSSLVWSTTPQHAEQLLKMEAPEFVDALNSAFVRENKIIFYFLD